MNGLFHAARPQAAPVTAWPKRWPLLALLLPALTAGFAACKESATPDSPTPPPATTNASKQSPAEPSVAPPGQSKTSVRPATQAGKILVFRNVRSWRRNPDFEEVLTAAGLEFEVKPSSEMAGTDLKPYSVVIIPGAQWQDNYYRHYAENGARFDGYVTNGGILLLELNGAEREGITLPGDVTMVRAGSRDNILTLPEHPILVPFGEKIIHANYASHGYLENVPKNATILVTEMEEEKPVLEKPTFVEYAHGQGRVIAACQCFHDQDNSGRGPLMESSILYAAQKKWFPPPK